MSHPSTQYDLVGELLLQFPPPLCGKASETAELRVTQAQVRHLPLRCVLTRPHRATPEPRQARNDDALVGK